VPLSQRPNSNAGFALRKLLPDQILSDIPMATSSQSKKSFAFVPVDKDSSHAAFLSFIRSHAVQGALRQKKLACAIASATQEIEKFSFRTGRFRILSSHTKVKTAKLKSQEGSQPRSMVEEDLVGARQSLTPQCTAIKMHAVPIVPSPGILDPFTSLAIKFSNRQQMVLSYCKSYIV
jgi:hypothetical protein